MQRLINFNAGPATLPQVVLERAQAELLDWRGSGMSVMEMSHRGEEFLSIARHARARLRALMSIPDDYAVLFLQGGATTQFAALPLNLCTQGGKADYVETGSWSKKAIAEARRYCAVRVIASDAEGGFRRVPPQAEWRANRDADFLHYTPNETIGGVEFHWLPDSGDVPLVADMSSTILSRPLPVERFGVIYGGAQKNMGIAGLTVVVVREDLLQRGQQQTPSTLRYALQASSESMLNTPPTYAWYLAGLVFDWIEEQGGLTAMQARNRAKAEALYRAIDDSGWYRNPVAADSRSWMNIPFVLADPGLDEEFLRCARDAGLVGLAGHRSAGGMRASLYNAMPESGVATLVEVMAEFERRHG